MYWSQWADIYHKWYTESMILLAHIIIALASVAWATVLIFKPSTRSFMASYGLIGATLISGTALVVTNSASLLHACVSGLVYVTVVSVITAVSQVRFQKLQAVRVRSK